MKGWFSIQDVSAGLVSHLLDPKPKDRILDMTAAPGMKSTHMAELSQNEAMIVANDLHAGRLSLIRQNRDRLGMNRIQLIRGDGRFPAIRPVDSVLVDAPCTGLGVLRKRGDLRWKRAEEDLHDLMPLQDALLDAAASVLEPGGILVYSTCTQLIEENEDRVEHFLENHPEFRVEDASAFLPSEVVSEQGFLQTWPDLHGMDGSFAARLRKEA
jgi:16S rRNA (cytosine967-C5)-methyltransferase